MRFSLTAAFAAALVVSEVVSASAISRPNHAKLARRMNRKKRCLQRPTVSPADYHQPAPTSSSSQVAAPAPTPDNSGNNNNNNNNNNNGNTGNTGGVGTIQLTYDPCGPSGATADPTSQGGPNGGEMWLNCGITGGGWNPPPITKDNMIYISLSDALNKPGSPFGSCSPYVGSFNNYEQQTGIPAILLASIALQESGCNPGAIGPNGEIGMMQITPDKCEGDCSDADNNIGIGARYFAGVVASSGGNLISAMGQYNGWFPGMTEADANNHPSCGSRNNLDYLQDVFNGYCQGVDPSSLNMGIFFNNSVNC